MKRALLRKVSVCTRNLLLSPPSTFKPNPNTITPLLSLPSISSNLRLFSSENDSSSESPNPLPETSLVQSQNKQLALDVEDISNKGKTKSTIKCTLPVFSFKVLYYYPTFLDVAQLNIVAN